MFIQYIFFFGYKCTLCYVLCIYLCKVPQRYVEYMYGEFKELMMNERALAAKVFVLSISMETFTNLCNTINDPKDVRKWGPLNIKDLFRLLDMDDVRELFYVSVVEHYSSVPVAMDITRYITQGLLSLCVQDTLMTTMLLICFNSMYEFNTVWYY